MNFKYLAMGAVIALASCGEEETDETVMKSGFEVSAIDSSASACSDFFHFTAGNWIKENPIPGTEARWGRFDQLAEENKKRVKAILEEYSGKDGLAKGSDEQLIGDLFYSGMDSAAVEAAGTSVIDPYMQRIDEAGSMSDLLAIWAEYSNFGVSTPFGISVEANLMNSSVHALYFGAGGLGLPDRDYYLKTDSVSEYIKGAYKDHLAKIFVIYGMDEAAAAAQAEQIYNVESQLAPLHKSRVEKRNIPALYNPMTYDELKGMAPDVDFDTYMGYYNLTFDTIIVTNPAFVEAFNGLYGSISLDAWKAYTKWHALDASVRYLPHAYVKQNFEFFSKVLYGTSEMQPRWKRVQGSLWGLGEQLGHLYVNKHFPEESKARVEKLVEDLRSAYRVRIENLTWMSDTTKKKAIEKLEAFTYKIGYPNKWKDYSDLEISRDSYIKNMMNMGIYKSKENFAKLSEPVDREDWGMGAHIVNAYYNPLNNEVVFPAGILQAPFFDPEADDAVNYGAIGGVIGHEFSHGFDDQGSRFGPDGNLSNWWTAGDKARFDELTKRLSEQYSAYEAIPGVFVNGDLTLGENIADLGGLTLAYYAYKHHMGEDGGEVIDGFTPEQRVFLGWAQVWQGHATDEQMRNQVATNPHSPAEFRVIGPMSNMKEFHEAWGCQDGDGMKRAEPIVIW